MLNNITKLAVCIVLTIQLVNCIPALNSHVQLTHKSSGALQARSSSLSSPNVGVSFCKTCIDFADQALDVLLNEILQIGVLGSCGEICALVQTKIPSQIIGVVCNILCDIAGVDEFVNIIDKVDLDPIWYCEILKACTIFDQGDATITSLSVMPNKGPQGKFAVDIEYVSQNGTGTGELAIEIKTIDGVPLGTSFLLEAQKPGKYRTNIELDAQQDPDCDPSQGPCEEWLPGLYPVEIAICNGECGSQHPHSKIYTQGLTNFTITE